MPNKRDLKLDEYDIGKYAYRELHNFCLQYPEKKKRITELRYPYQSPRITGLPGGTGVGDPTGKNAERAALLADECKMIEDAASEAGGDDSACLLLAVTQDVPYRYLKLLKGLEMGEKKFYAIKRKFYFLLAKKRNIL